jgi:hypothetical protein
MVHIVTSRICNLCPKASAPLTDIMRLVLLASFVASVASQAFESADFNVMEALIAQGVNITALPQLSELVERSSDVGCKVAVSADLEFLKTKTNAITSAPL